jgi:hypothetical protein
MRTTIPLGVWPALAVFIAVSEQRIAAAHQCRYQPSVTIGEWSVPSGQNCVRTRDVTNHGCIQDGNTPWEDSCEDEKEKVFTMQTGHWAPLQGCTNWTDVIDAFVMVAASGPDCNAS